MHKTILITGCTDGIGRLAALKLAEDGHHILAHGRNEEKLQGLIADIKAQSGNENIQACIADFSDLNAVNRMSEELSDSLTRLDVLINNAGVFKTSEPVTKDGLDARMVVNYLAPYLLTHKLMDVLKTSSQARIINLSSAAQNSIDEQLLTGKVTASAQEVYAQSKLALLMWSFYLAKKESSIATIALNPGSLLNTKMVQEAYGKFWSPADKGADIIYQLATDDNYLAHSGEYYDNDRGQFGPAHPDAYDNDKIAKLITTTEVLIE